MFELNCEGVIPGCARVIRAGTPTDVFRYAVQQAHQSGVDKITPDLAEKFRTMTTELPN